MPIYHQLGKIPRKRHTVFRKEDGSLHPEELMGNKGFVGPSSLIYHLHEPTRVRKVSLYRRLDWKAEEDPEVRHRHFQMARIKPSTSPTLDRTPILFNSDVSLSFVVPQQRQEDFFYRNSDGDEVVYVSDGEGVLESMLGNLPFGRGDYLVIPRGILHRYLITSDETRFLVIESRGDIRTPRRYRNEVGQLTESSPYSERDIRRPDQLSTHDETGEFRLLVKKGSSITEVVLAHHPFDVVGWDGYYYPWAFNIDDFEPRVGRIHLPPPTHQTFEGDGFVICSFCPRPYDFDPQSIPAPYNHSNVMSDEVLYYASPEFMSRKGIEYGSITLHPDGIPHGPHPGKTEESIGMKETRELAVMLDTFRPLQVSSVALSVEDPDYQYSWVQT